MTMREFAKQSSWAQKALNCIWSGCCGDHSALPSPSGNGTPKPEPTGRRVLHFGASDFARGFLIRKLADGGCDIVVADSSPNIVYPLHDTKKYVVRLVGENGEQLKEVRIRDAIFSFSEEAMQEVCCAEVVTVCAALNNIDTVTETLMRGLRLRQLAAISLETSGTEVVTAKLDILICQDDVQGAKEIIQKRIVDTSSNYVGLTDWLEENVSFVETVVDCIVPDAHMQKGLQHPLEVVSEDYNEWFVAWGDLTDATRFHIPGLILTDRIERYAERKLQTVDCAHTVAAYYGHAMGYEDIRSAIMDPQIEAVVRGAMMETSKFLCRRHRFEKSSHLNFIEQTMGRLRNPKLTDNIERIARGPLRKLEPTSCLIRPLHIASQLGGDIDCLAKGTAACLLYNQPGDAECKVVKAWLERDGILRGVRNLTGLCHERSLMVIANACASLEAEVSRRPAVHNGPSRTRCTMDHLGRTTLPPVPVPTIRHGE